MSARVPYRALLYILPVAGLIAVLTFAAATGYLLAGLSPRPSYEEELSVLKRLSQGRGGEDNSSAAPGEPPPLGLWVSALPGTDLAAIQEEVRLAAEAGIDLCAIAVPPPSPDALEGTSHIGELIGALRAANPEVRVLLRLPLDLGVEWLSAHPEACVLYDGMAHAVPSLASEAWRAAAANVLRAVAQTAQESEWPVDGYVLECLEAGRWLRTGPDDRGPAGTAAFRAWLQRRYGSDRNLQEAWGMPEATLAGAEVPPTDDEDAGESGDDGHDAAGPTLYADRESQPVVDYRRYSAAVTAEAIAFLAQALRHEIGPERQILAVYGHSFDAPDGSVKHAALSSLWRSAVNGFVTPVSYYDRGLGGTGGPMGPIQSAIRRGKAWYLVDDTRTGIARDSVTGEITQLKGLRIEDVYAVQARNFGAAIANGIGLLWADSDGTGALIDKTMCTRFGGMADRFAEVWPRPAWRTPRTSARTMLCVVADELSAAHLRRYPDLAEDLLVRARDAALLAGVPTAFCLLDDIMEGNAPDAAAYLFLNAFHLNEHRRNAVHGWLRDRSAAGIWVYAPGALGIPDMERGIQETTGFRVRRTAQPATSGSVGILGTALVPTGGAIGVARPVDPLFEIVVRGDDEAAVLAKYAASGGNSIAMRFRPDGWASVYFAEPAVTPNVLRQVLAILEEHIYLESNPDQAPDVAHFGPNVIAIHGRGQADRERRLSLNGLFDITDMLNDEVGWLQKQVLVFPVRFGETFVLRLTPVAASSTVPETAPPTEDTRSDAPEAPPEEPTPPVEGPQDLPEVLP